MSRPSMPPATNSHCARTTRSSRPAERSGIRWPPDALGQSARPAAYEAARDRRDGRYVPTNSSTDGGSDSAPTPKILDICSDQIVAPVAGIEGPAAEVRELLCLRQAVAVLDERALHLDARGDVLQSREHARDFAGATGDDLRDRAQYPDFAVRATHAKLDIVPRTGRARRADRSAQRVAVFGDDVIEKRVDRRLDATRLDGEQTKQALRPHRSRFAVHDHVGVAQLRDALRFREPSAALGHRLLRSASRRDVDAEAEIAGHATVPERSGASPSPGPRRYARPRR